MKESALSQAAREARNAYAREWRKKNKDKVKTINQAYWERKAGQASDQRKEEEKQGLNTAKKDNQPERIC